MKKAGKPTVREADDEVITMAHGGGGLATRDLIREVMVEALGNPILNKLDDGACVTIPEPELVLTTDSYVVDPVFFPGGDIGRLSVCGTVNDLAMQGGEPRYLTVGMILEEGFRVRDLRRIVQSAADTAKESGVQVVAGDTKVIERRDGQKKHAASIFINTAGVAVRKGGIDVSVSNAKSGDAVILSGTAGDHGIAIMSVREGLQLESNLLSDVAPLWGMIRGLLEEFPSIHCLRDPTRGGVAAALCDIAEESKCGIRVEEAAVPIRKEVAAACDILGLDALHVANEGKAVIVCSREDADGVLAALRKTSTGQNAARIGTVTERHPGRVVLETRIGGERIVMLPAGEDLPRIC